jgi:hypothetical protein
VAFGGSVAGGLTISGGTAVISGSALGGQAVTFAGAGGELVVDNPFSFSATVSGFAKGDAFDFGGFGSGANPPFIEAAGIPGGTQIAVVDGTHLAILNLAGAYTSASFNLASDGTGGLLVTHA